MKVFILQPFYYTDHSRAEECFSYEMQMLDSCTPDLDLILLPESADAPCYASNAAEEQEDIVRKYTERILKKARETARRCHALVFVNASDNTETGIRNTTFAFDRNGQIVGRYYKQHLTPGETEQLDSVYTFQPSEPYILELEGVRYGFLTCYDFYFYEAFAALAHRKPDVIIGCSHQRTDTYEALEMMTRFCAYNCNAYVLRASVSMGIDAAVGGASMIVSPGGRIISSLHNEQGYLTADIDVHQKYYKAAGFCNPPSAHHEYVEQGRRPWKYRPAGPAIVPYDDRMPYPRICAHRGFNTIAPENSMPAFGAAVAMGAQEIEFDLWYTKDKELVSIHDNDLERVSDGTGVVWDYTYEELLAFDFGSVYGEEFRGMKITKFEEILQKFAGHVIMNIHVKTWGNDVPYDEELLQKIVGLIDRYDCRRHVYFMTGNDILMRQLEEAAPDIRRCCGGGDPERSWRIVERAIELGCQKVQLYKPYFNQEMIDLAHANGIFCNVFWSDEEEEACKFLDMGIDTILTNDYQRIAEAVKKRL